MKVLIRSWCCSYLLTISSFCMEKEPFAHDRLNKKVNIIEKYPIQVSRGAIIAKDFHTHERCVKLVIANAKHTLPLELQTQIAHNIFSNYLLLDKVRVDGSIYNRSFNIIGDEFGPITVLSPKATKIATISIDKKIVYIKDLKNMHLVRKLRNFKESIFGVSWALDEKKIAIVLSNSGKIIIHKIENNQKIQKLNNNVIDNNFVWSPSSRYLGTSCMLASVINPITIYDIASGDKIQELKHNEIGGSEFAWSPNEREIVSISYLDGQIKIWNVQNGQLIKRLIIRHLGFKSISAITWTLKGKEIVIGFTGGMMWLWDKEKKKLIQTFQGHKKMITAIACSTNDKKVSTGFTDGTIQIWNKNKNEQLQTLKKHKDMIRNIIWLSPNKFVVSSQDGIISTWEKINNCRLSNPIKEALKVINKKKIRNTREKNLKIKDIWKLCYTNGSLSPEKMLIMIYYLEYKYGPDNPLVKRGKFLITRRVKNS